MLKQIDPAPPPPDELRAAMRRITAARAEREGVIGMLGSLGRLRDASAAYERDLVIAAVEQHTWREIGAALREPYVSVYRRHRAGE